MRFAREHPSTRGRRYPSGHVDLFGQPHVIRHATVSTGKPDVRSLQLGLEVVDLRVSLELADARELIADLQRALHWLDTGEEPE